MMHAELASCLNESCWLALNGTTVSKQVDQVPFKTPLNDIMAFSSLTEAQWVNLFVCESLHCAMTGRHRRSWKRQSMKM